MRHAILCVNMKCFCEGHNASSGLDREALEPREKKFVCAEVSNARAYASGFCVVFTSKNLSM